MGQIDKNMPELAYLLTEVEKKYGRRIATTTDFESLSVVIEHQIGELISSSTLKGICQPESDSAGRDLGCSFKVCGP